MDAPDNKRRVLRWEPDGIPADEGGMELRLTYDGPLYSQQGENRLPQRVRHVHDIRKCFHKQLKNFWARHPYLKERDPTSRQLTQFQHFMHDGFDWLPLSTEQNGTICRVEILLLRMGAPGRVIYDMDNRLKVIFDALRKAKGPSELWIGCKGLDPITPEPDGSEEPFFVLLEDDSLITHAAVTSDMLLQDVKNAPEDSAVRMVITVKIQPYRIIKPGVLVFA